MELTEAQRDRIAAGKKWLAEVCGESATQLIDRLNGYEASFNAALDGLTGEQWSFAPAADKWSIRDVCHHITHSVRSMAMLTETLASGKDGPKEIVMGLKDEDCGASVAELGAQLRKAFQRAEESIRRFDGDVDTAKTTEHPVFGALNCKEWAVFNLMHISIQHKQIVEIDRLMPRERRVITIPQCRKRLVRLIFNVILRRHSQVLLEPANPLQRFPRRYLGETRGKPLHQLFHERDLIRIVEYGERLTPPKLLDVTTQNPQPETVKRPRPSVQPIPPETARRTITHFSRRFVRERQCQYFPRVHAPLTDKMRNAFHDHPRFARARTCQHQRISVTPLDRVTLRLV